MKEKTIYAKWVAIELRKQGFKIIRMGINEKFPKYDTYVFEFTPELDAALSKLSKNK